MTSRRGNFKYMGSPPWCFILYSILYNRFDLFNHHPFGLNYYRRCLLRSLKAALDILATDISYGHEVPIDNSVLSVGCGSLAAARRNCLGVRCVPKVASHDSVFSVSFGEKRRLELILQGPESAHKRHLRSSQLA